MMPKNVPYFTHVIHFTANREFFADVNYRNRNGSESFGQDANLVLSI